MIPLFCLGALLGVAAGAQSTSSPAAPASPQNPQTLPATPAAKKLTEKQIQQQNKKLSEELSAMDKKWLNEDVAYIITEEERETFLHLGNEDEREQFIEAFWARRNPDPESPYNSFEEEHYRRIAYANEHYTAGEPGWKTDRGQIYIRWGPPSELHDHDAGGGYDRPLTEGGGETQTYPYEDWVYNYIDGIGSNIQIEFVDQCMCGEFKFTTDPGAKDALALVPGAGLSMYEEMGLASKADRFTRADGTTLPTGSYTSPENSEFEVLSREALLFAPPKIEYKDLAEIVDHSISYSLLPISMRADYIKVTEDTVMVPITVQLYDRNLTYKESGGVEQASLQVFGTVSTISGRVTNYIQDPVEVGIPDSTFNAIGNMTVRYQKSVFLKPGNYKVELAVKDVNQPNKLGTKTMAINVPDYKDDELSASTIILADQLMPMPAKQVGTGQFVLGDSRVRPVVGNPPAFSVGQELYMWMEVYSLSLNKLTHKPNATVEYTISDIASGKKLLDTTDTADTVSNAAAQMTLEKQLPLANLPPGNYLLSIKVTDNINQQTITQTASFLVKPEVEVLKH